MISNEASLFRAEEAPSYAQAGLFSKRRAFYNLVKLRFLQQSAIYLGSTLSNREIKTSLDQKSYIRS